MKNTVFKGNRLNEISFPLGGIGTGCIGLAGNGRLIDWEIFNRPNKGSTNGYSHFAVKATKKGKLVDARVINGDVNKDLAGTLGRGFGSGLNAGSMAGFPHFKKCVFTGEFPIAKVDFSDEAFPGKIRLCAWNPLIPLNDRDSGIPAAFFEFEITNTSGEALDYTVCGVLMNPYGGSVNDFVTDAKIRGLYLHQTNCPPDNAGFGDITLATDNDGDVSYQQYWYRGSWHDGLERYWRNFTEQSEFENRTYPGPGSHDHAAMAIKKSIAPGKTKRFRYVISWSSPNCVNYWSRYVVKDENGNEKDVTWKNYYATQFENSTVSAAYALTEWERLWKGTKRYHDELFGVTLPAEVREAISATTSVLKSPTVMRLENGEFYGWEGTWENVGSCEGTCTHVWNYAYALCFLFPKLERSIRETDFKYNQDENGRMAFRMTLPLGRERSGFRACLDGQMGGVIKTYREWKLCGNDDWLREYWPAVKKSLEYAWSDKNPDMWDRDQDGVLEGRQHHTLDVELFGPSSWLQGFYLAALKCAAEMAERLGETETAEKYREIFLKGQKWSEENLFNGKWYCQKLDLTDRTYLDRFEGAEAYWNDESGEIKYQIGEGCLLDQCLAQWHANINGIGYVFDKKHLRTALKNVYKNNFMPDMRSHYNTFRLFAVNDEAGAIICTFPKGIKTPAIPIPYAQESMHGFEYAFAGLLISEGMVKEGVSVVKAIRDRYRGDNRNPWNEIECGSNYARSMASYALMPIFSGFRFAMQDKAIGFCPVTEGDFRSIWAVDSAWGRFERRGGRTDIKVIAGRLSLAELELPYYSKVNSVMIDGKPSEFTFRGGKIIAAIDAGRSISVAGELK
ncbi:MAG: hypothetical protein J6X34_07120 [Clostridia bacterium]|nr:hypothetical protein [Clostridia bacterium]